MDCQQTRSLNNNNPKNQNNRTSENQWILISAPTPPVNGRAKFVRHNNRRSSDGIHYHNQTQFIACRCQSNPISRTTNHTNSSSNLSYQADHHDGEECDGRRIESTTFSTTIIDLVIRQSMAPPIQTSKEYEQHRRIYLINSVKTTAKSSSATIALIVSIMLLLQQFIPMVMTMRSKIVSKVTVV